MKSTCCTLRSGSKFWRNANGERHREDGPAIEFSVHSKARTLGLSDQWYLNGVRVEPFTPEQLPLLLLRFTDL